MTIVGENIGGFILQARREGSTDGIGWFSGGGDLPANTKTGPCMSAYVLFHTKCMQSHFDWQLAVFEI